MNLKALNQRIEKLQARKSELEKRNSSISREIKKILETMRAFGIKFSDLKDGNKKKSIKYVSPDGQTWAGRGAKPKWLVAQLEAGATLESFLAPAETEQQSPVDASAEAVV